MRSDNGRHVDEQTLFMRENRTSTCGKTIAVHGARPATYVQHQHGHPMAITWRLHSPVPAELFEDAHLRENREEIVTDS